MTRSADDRLVAVFQRSIMLSTSAAGVTLWIAEGSWMPSAITPVVAVIGWLLVDRLRLFALPLPLANLLGLAALWVAGVEFVGGTIYDKLLSGAHLIVYLTWVVLLLQKTDRQYWWILLLSLLQLAISAVLTTTAAFGGAMVGMLLLMIWTLSVFSQFRVQQSSVARRATDAGAPADETLPGQSGARILVRNGLQRDPAEAWISWRFRGLVGMAFAGSLVLSYLVFAAFPRIWIPGSVLGAPPNSQEIRGGIVHRTGFTDTVTLGEIGSVLQSDGRVLQFAVTDLNTGLPVDADRFAEAMDMDDLRFRGNAMGNYSGGTWMRMKDPRSISNDIRLLEPETDVFGRQFATEPAFRLEVIQDPPVGQFAFSVFPICRARAVEGSGRIVQRVVTGALVWTDGQDILQDAQRSFVAEVPRVRDTSTEPFEHWAISQRWSARRRADAEVFRRRVAHEAFITDDLETQLPRLFQLSNEICTENGVRLDGPGCVDRILRYLSPENGFSYSLNLTRADRSLDPIEDFVLNLKSGHCEYFGSACTLMLQSAGIPARLINGFYGSEVNALTGRNEVKQRHAHVWVEVFLNDRWTTVDPTPPAERQVTVASVRTGDLMTDLRAALIDVWNNGFHNMTLQRQKDAIRPMIGLWETARETVASQGIASTLKMFIREYLLSPGSWFSWHGGLITFLLLGVISLLQKFRILRRLADAVRSALLLFRRGSRRNRSAIRFYSRFCSLCERHGLILPSSGTALENAGLAAEHFATRLASPELQSLPRRVARAFNDVRFGELSLSDEHLGQIGSELDSFSEALESRRAGAAVT